MFLYISSIYQNQRLQIAGLSNSTGIGGGFFWSTLFNALLNFSVKAATAESQVFVSCGAVGATIYSVGIQHPSDKRRPLIDYGTATVLLPALMLGVSLGVLLNIYLPALIITSLLFLVLVLVAIRTLSKGIQQFRKERKTALDVVVITEIATITSSTDNAHPEIESGVQEGISNENRSPHTRVGALISTLQQLWKPLIHMMVVTGAFLGFQIGKNQYGHCDWEYGLLFAVQAILMVVVSTFTILFLPRVLPPPFFLERKEIPPCEPPPTGSEPPQVEPALYLNESPAPPSSSFAKAHRTSLGFRLTALWAGVVLVGVLSGILGLGGGILLSPMMMELGLHPQSAAASSNIIVLFSALSAAVTYGISGRLNLSYVAVYAPVCLIGGFFGVFVLRLAIQRMKAASTVMILMGTLVAVSAGLIAGFAGRQAVEDVVHNGLYTADFCAI